MAKEKPRTGKGAKPSSKDRKIRRKLTATEELSKEEKTKRSEENKRIAKHPLFEKRPKNFNIGGTVQPKRDLTRYVRWPKYIRLQRQRRILMQRLKVPPALNHFNHAIDKNQATQVLRLFSKYKPETRPEKKDRLMNEASARKDNKELETKKPILIKYGLNHVTDLIELKKAKLVLIAHDVDPIELVCWLPALCRKKDVAYCIIKGKARLGQLTHTKTAACVCLEAVRKEDRVEFDTMAKNFHAQFNDNVDLRRRWGGGILGFKSNHALVKKERTIQLEQAKKQGLL